MSNAKLAILIGVVVISVAGLMTLQRQFHARLLRAENEALQLALTRSSAENQRLSNFVAQAKLAQASARDQFEEISKLRAEVGRLHQEQEAFYEAVQAQVDQSASNQSAGLFELRSEMSALSEDIAYLGEALQELSATASMPQLEENSVEPADREQDQTLSIRIITTQGNAFAENLKHSTDAEEWESFREVYSRFLRAQGVDLSGVAGLIFDERTGRVIVRGPRATLDLIERLTVALDQGQ